MKLDLKNRAVAIVIMGAIILFNIGVATNLLTAAGVGLAAAVNSQNIYILAGLELILLLLAYVAAKNQPLPIPS